MLVMPTVLGMTHPEYLTISGAVARLAERGVTVTGQTVRRWTKNGKVRAMRRRSGGQLYISVEDIDAMLVPLDGSAGAA